MRICKYRNCEKEIPKQIGSGRKRLFCDNNCKRMESYFKGKLGESHLSNKTEQENKNEH